MRLRVEHLESRLTPAALDLAGGVLSYTGDSGSDTVTQSVSGTGLVFAANTAIVLTQDAYDAGFRANGMVAAGPRSAVASEVIDLGSGTNVVNIRATDAPTEVDCNGIDSVNVCGNAPTNTTDLSGILGAISVAGDGDDTLAVSDNGATSGNSGVYVDGTGVYGLAGPTDAVPIYTGGPLASLKVTTSNSSSLNTERVELAGSAGPLALVTGAGNDTVNVTADTTGTISVGIGNDKVYVQPGVTFTGDLHVGSGFNWTYYGAPTWGTIAGTVGV